MTKNLFFICLLISLNVRSEDARPALDLDFLTGEPHDFGLSIGSMEFFGLGDLRIDKVDCHRESSEGVGSNVSLFAKDFAKVAVSSSCANIKNDPTNRFSTANCTLLTSCRDAKLSKDKSNLLNYYTLSRMVAEDYVAVNLGDDIHVMEKIDALRKFAEKKYGNEFVSNCTTPFDYKAKTQDSNSCDMELVDRAFGRLENQDEYKNFLSNFKSGENHESAVQNFFSTKTDNLANDAFGSDNEVIDALSNIVSSQSKNQNKIQTLFIKLQDLKKQGKLDPVFGFDPIEVSSSGQKKSPHYDFFTKLFSKHLNRAAAKDAIEKHRREYAQSMLKNNCPSTKHLSDICKNTQSISKSNPLSNEERAKYAHKLKDSEDSNRFASLSIAYPNGIQSEEDSKIVLDAKRCELYGFVEATSSSLGSTLNSNRLYGSSRGQSVNYGLSGSDYRLDVKPVQMESTSPVNFKEMAILPASSPTPVPSVQPIASPQPTPIAVAEKSSESSVSGTSSDSQTKAEIVGDDKKSTSAIAEGINKFQQGMNTFPGANPQGNIANNNGYAYNNYAFPSPQESSGLIQPAKIPTPVNGLANGETVPTSGDLNAKIADLTRQLSATQSKLDKLSAGDSEEEGDDKLPKEKSSDVSKTIASLKDQIQGLKAQQKLANAQNNKGNDVASTSDASRFNTRREIASADSPYESAIGSKRLTQETAAQEFARTSYSAPVAQESLASGARTNSVSQALAQANSGAAKTGIVLTKIDGLTSDAASEVINNKINETIQSGEKSFFVEEGGFVKQVIVEKNPDGTVKKDESGKIVYTKIVKGKVGDVKLAEVKKPNGRSPAGVFDSAADWKRKEDEQLRDRTKLRELNSLTGGILKHQ